jgi:hypothetical protein
VKDFTGGLALTCGGSKKDKINPFWRGQRFDSASFILTFCIRVCSTGHYKTIQELSFELALTQNEPSFLRSYYKKLKEKPKGT